MKPLFFSTQQEFRKWLEKNHDKETSLLVGFYKKHTRKPCMTWPESVDQALCFGWIDSVRQSIDEDCYQIKFSPRKKDSIWSAVNIAKVEDLINKKLMQPAGMLSYSFRKEEKSKIYSFENEEMPLLPEYENRLKANKKAWDYFQSLAPSYRKSSIHWIMSAKREATQIARLEKIITDSELGLNAWKDSKYKASVKK